MNVAPVFTGVLRIGAHKREKRFDIRFSGYVPLVLAAGASARMGQPKALLPLGGRACLEWIAEGIAAAGLAPPVVVTRASLRQAVAARLAAWPGAVLCENPCPEKGQTSSLLVGLQHLPSHARAFLIYPVDTPLVTPADLGRLCGALGPGVRVVAPSFERRRGHPVVVDAALGPAFLALPPDVGARAVIDAYAGATTYVDFDDDRALVDMDTPADYERCHRRWLAARARIH